VVRVVERDERLTMLDQLVGVPSVELKMNVPADQRMRLSGMRLDAMDGILREVFFFDTPDLTLFRNGLVVRARRTQAADDDTVVKLRPAVPDQLPRKVRTSKNLKIEMDVTRSSYVVSASIKGTRRPGLVRKTVTEDKGPLDKLFTKEQRAFFADHVPEGVSWDDMVPLGPVLVVKLKFIPKGMPSKAVVEQWHYPGEVPLVEMSTKATPQSLVEVATSWRKYIRERGLTASGPQEPKTRKALEFYARHLRQPQGAV
jgi:hypothetical protein